MRFIGGWDCMEFKKYHLRNNVFNCYNNNLYNKHPKCDEYINLVKIWK